MIAPKTFPKTLQKEFEAKLDRIRVLEDMQIDVFNDLLLMLNIQDGSYDADVIFDAAFNQTPHSIKSIKFE